MRLKASEWKKVTYSLICVFMFFVHAKKKNNNNNNKKNEKSYNGNVLNTNALTNRFRCVCVYLREPVCGNIDLVYILTL